MHHKSIAVLLIIALLPAWLMLDVAPVAAGGTVTNCSDDTDFSNKLSSGGTIDFSCGTATIVLSSTKTISADTTIDGGGMITLSGGGVQRLFVVNSGVALTLTNITIRDGYESVDGGAIYSTGVVNISNSQFLSNTVDSGYSGGAIESFGVLNISHSEFAYNRAGNGGALFPREATSFTTISGSSFHDNSTTNTANGWGGAMLVWNGAQVSIDSSSFVSNTAQQGGMAYLTSVSVLTVTNSSLSSNRSTGVIGGALVNHGTATVNNSTLDHNSADSGGGIWNGATLTLNSTSLNDNTALQFGGGLSNSGTATLNNSMMRGNTSAQTGGAVYGAGITTLNSSTLSGNSASIGGGLTDNIGTTTINNSTLSGNSASNAGGGIYSFGTVNLNSSTLSGNTAGNGGGGFYNDHSVATVTNSTLSGNSTATLGGGFFNSGSATFYNATLANNSAATGGELYIQAGAPTVLSNTILAYSPASGNCAGTITSSEFTLSSDLTCGLPPANKIKGLDPNGLDPLLSVLGNFGGPTQVHMPKANSPAVDGIVGNDAPATDQRGMPRPAGPGYDIGSVERQPSDTDLAPRLWLPLIER
jgi:hypothetical protein